jgi:hypothetical protein
LTTLRNRDDDRNAKSADPQQNMKGGNRKPTPGAAVTTTDTPNTMTGIRNWTAGNRKSTPGAAVTTTDMPNTMTGIRSWTAGNRKPTPGAAVTTTDTPNTMTGSRNMSAAIANWTLALSLRRLTRPGR